MAADATVEDEVGVVSEVDKEMEEEMGEEEAADVDTNSNAPLVPIHHTIAIHTEHVDTPFFFCNNPNKGHKYNATFDNKMGGFAYCCE